MRIAHARLISLSPAADTGYTGVERRSRSATKSSKHAPPRRKVPFAPFTYEKHRTETTAHAFATDQFGTQLDPPAHWHQCFPAIDELPATLALRKIAVISIADKVQSNANYHLTADDVRAWERTHGMVPAGSVVMVRSDWSKRWPDAARIQPADGKFPGAIKTQAVASGTQDPAPRPRTAGCGLDTDADRRGLAHEQRLHAGRGSCQSRSGAGNRRPRRDRISAVQRRDRWLRELHRHLSGRLEIAALAPATLPKRPCPTMKSGWCGTRRRACGSARRRATSRKESRA